MTERSEQSIVMDKDSDAFIILTNWVDNLKSWNDNDCNIDIARSGHIGFDLTEEFASESDRAIATRVGSPEGPRRVAHIRYKISSALLGKVSKRLNAMFSNNPNKTITVSDDGKYCIYINGFMPKAVEHVMNVIHVKTRRLPKTVELEVLAHIVAMADYYGMEEAVAFHVETWADAVARKKTPGMGCRDLMLQTFVAKILGDDESFEWAAGMFVRHSDGPIPSLCAPMLRLADDLEKRRRQAVEKVVDTIKLFPDEVFDWACDEDACKAMLLGLYTMRQRFGTIQYPFDGISIKILSSQLSQLIKPPACYGAEDERSCGGHSCDLQEYVWFVGCACKEALEEMGGE